MRLIVKHGTGVKLDTGGPTADIRDAAYAKYVVVQTKYSAISLGTELGLITNPEIPDGTPLGYSLSGYVLKVGRDVKRLTVGDPVACYGAPYVRHAEYVTVPELLCVTVPETLLKSAAFVGLGAIAVHSLRKAELQFGEWVWNIGLGPLGNLISQLAIAANYRVMATDRDLKRVERARSCGIADAYVHERDRLGVYADRLTGGALFDAVIVNVTARDPAVLNEALLGLRMGGKIVLVGNVPVALDRDLFFAKEASLSIVRAGGPGRYDASYEREGLDYPYVYVRWTEGRNMAEFIRNVREGRVLMDRLITHEFAFHDAPTVYRDLLTGRSDVLGAVFRYDT